MSLLKKLRNQKLQKAILVTVMSLALGFHGNSQVYASYIAGEGASTKGQNSTVVGDNASSSSAIGSDVIIGADASAGGESAIVGAGASGVYYSVAVGYQTEAEWRATAIGYQAKATEWSTVALGNCAVASERGNIAVGSGAQATGASTIVIGDNSQATGMDSITIGGSAQATGECSITIGDISDATGEHSMAIGVGANASGIGSISFGYHSSATDDYTVSFGDKKTKRRLVNVAAGTAQTDAVNVSQLISKGSYNADTKQLSLQSNSGSNVLVDLSALPTGGTSYTAGDGIIISSGVISVKKDGTVTEGNTDVVTGGTVYDAIKDKANVTYIDAELANKADTDLGNINDDGKGVIGNIAEEALADDLNAKANVNASNVADHTAEWGAAIGTGAVEDGNGELVTGGTVFNAVKGKADIAYVDNELLTKADVDLSNITEGGQTVIQNIAKGSVKLENGTNTTVSSTDNADGSLTYKVNVEGNGVAEEGNTGLISGDTLYNTVNEITTNIDADLEGKANADASNVADHTAEWGSAIGTGAVEDGNGELVTGDTVYEAVKDKADKDYVDEQLSGKADTDLGNLTDEGKDVIKDIAKDTVKVEDGLNTTVSSTENADGSISYQVNVEGNGVAEAGNTGLINGDTLYNTVEEINKNITNVTEGINAELDGKANADASNVADHTAEWGAAIGTGKVEAGNGELVTGDTVYNAVKDKADADFGNITDEGKDVIGDIAQEALQDDLDGKANIDASNIETDKWADKLGTGTIVDGDKNLVNGDTVYDAIKNMGGGLVMSDGKTITVGKDDGATVIDVSKYNGDGNTENRVITGVATDANDMSSAANVGYVNQSVGQLANDFNRGLSELDSQMKKGVAGAAALAALNPLDYDPENKLNFAAGVGSYKGESATALGMFYRPNENVMFSLGGAFGNGENMWNAGITFNLDKPSASTSKAAMARAIKTMAAENDALEAKTAEQDAKIALLTEQVEALLAAQEK